MKPFAVLLSLLALCIGCRHSTPVAPSQTPASADLAAKTVALVDSDEDEGTTRAYCTAVWISKTELLTAAHCVQTSPLAQLLGVDPGIRYAVKDDVLFGPQGVEIRYPVTRKASVERVDQDHDLALLRAEGEVPPHATAELGGEPAQGQRAQSMGHSKGLWWSYSSGDIAAIRFMALGSVSMQWIQTTAPTSPGNSGGGLFDAEGKLIGVCSRAIASPRAQNLNFFVHLNHVRAFLEGAS